MDLKSTYNKIAGEWSKDHNLDTWWIEGTEKFISLLKKEATVLDVGCGSGVKSKYLLDHKLKVTGIDFSENMIKIAKKEVKGVKFEVVDIYDLDIYKQKFDAVFVQAVLLHIPKDRIIEVIKKLKNKLNKNGLLYIAVKEKRHNGVDSEVLKENDYGYEYERFFSYFTLDEIKTYLKQLGFGLIYETTTNLSKTNWIQVVAKIK